MYEQYILQPTESSPEPEMVPRGKEGQCGVGDTWAAECIGMMWLPSSCDVRPLATTSVLLVQVYEVDKEATPLSY